MNIFLKKTILAAQIVLTALFSFSNARAAGEVDPTFNAAVQETAQGNVLTIVAQPDGKILVGGNFTVAGNFGRSNVVRLNPDGTVDTTFTPPDFARPLNFNGGFPSLKNVNIYAIALQADGKVVVGGDFSRVADQSKSGIARLNADGSLDNSFNVAINNNPNDPTFFARIFDVKIQSDNKILIGGFFTIAQSGITRSSFARVNTDGSIDNTFASQNISSEVRAIAVQSDGKIVYAVSASTATVRRVTADGISDNSFLDASVFAGSGSTAIINVLTLQADGKILVGGSFNLGGSPQRGVIRLNANGAVDPDFNVGGTGVPGEVRDIAVLPDGKILIGGNLGSYNNVARSKTARLNADGALDTAFNYNPGNNAVVSAVAVLPDGGFIFGGTADFSLTRFNANGTLDTTFQGVVYQRGIVNQVAAQPNGNVLIGGVFRRVNGIARQNIARLNADGGVDAGFVANITGRVATVALQSDGKVLVGGGFTQVNGTAKSLAARLNADGTLDADFQTTLASGSIIEKIIALPDGKILIAGNFRLTGYNFVLNVARLNSNGSTDTTFAQAPVNTPGLVRAVEIQPDGKIVVVGNFTQIAGANRGRIARLNADGTLDVTFSPPSGANNNVNDLAIQSNGNIVIGGEFLAVNGSPVGTRPYIARLFPDGTLDVNFAGVANNFVYALDKQADDKIIVGGIFSQINGVSRFGIARLNADGTFDNSFAGNGTNDIVLSISVQSDNKILIGGEFSRINENTSNVGVARLLNAPSAARTRFDFDGDGRADIAVFRPSNGNWYQLRSQNNSFAAVQFGQSNDQLAPADYDGDGRTDLAVFRDVVPGAGNLAYFYISNSADNSFRPEQFGATGDLPVSGDWDGDGKGDLAVYRDGSLTGGQSSFYYRPSSQPGVNFRTIQWGAAGDKPLVGDFDGDGKLDAAVFRASTATWYILRSSNNQVIQQQFGLSTDVPVPADYDGDGTANIAVFRPSTGTWFTSTNPQNNYGAIQFGANGDLPVPADYDGDGKADVAVFRPSNGAWYLNRSTAGFIGVSFGSAEDKPIQNAYIR